MRTGIIYGYVNLESGKMYIGQTLHPDHRWKDHRYGKYKNGWHKDYQKNPDKYEYSVIEYDVPEDKLDEREIFWINFFDSYNNGYNLTEGGNSTRGYKHTEEYKLYMSKLHSGSNNPFYNNHSLAGKNHPMYGKKLTDETRKKISDAVKGEKHPMYGKKHSEETRKKISEASNHKGENNPMYGKRGELSPTYGRHWYNNGIHNVFRYECPEGFVPGLLKNKK